MQGSLICLGWNGHLLIGWTQLIPKQTTALQLHLKSLSPAHWGMHVIHRRPTMPRTQPAPCGLKPHLHFWQASKSEEHWMQLEEEGGSRRHAPVACSHGAPKGLARRMGGMGRVGGNVRNRGQQR